MYVDVDGYPMRLDANDTLGLEHAGIYEPLITRYCQKVIRPGDTVLDLGANIGYHTLKFARSVGVNGKVFAFEPEPGCFAILAENVEMNGCRNVVCEQKAVSDITGEVALYLCDDNNGHHSMLQSPGYRGITVDSIRLDDYFSGYQKIDFIKMDIEGAETRALDGMKTLLSTNHVLKIIIEISRKTIRTIPAILDEFDSYYINDLEDIVEPLNIEKVEKTFEAGLLGITNFLFVKGNCFELPWV